MDPEFINNIAKQISEGAILIDWKYLLILVLLLFISGLLGGLIGGWGRGYGTHSGKIKSIERNINSIQSQLQQSTEITEQIKSQIEHSVWRKKEIESIRREKLEEYMQLVHMLPQNYQNAYRNIRSPSKQTEFDQYLIDKIRIIQLLYFPELTMPTATLTAACVEFTEWLMDGQRILLESTDSEEPPDNEEHKKLYIQKLRVIHSGISVVEKNVIELTSKLNIC